MKKAKRDKQEKAKPNGSAVQTLEIDITEAVSNRLRNRTGEHSIGQAAAEASNEQPIQTAMEEALAELGDIVIDEARTPEQMRQLGEQQEKIDAAQIEFLRKSEAAKLAKKALESEQTVLSGLVREFTHKKPMPLFDLQEREQDQRRMELEGEHADFEGAGAAADEAPQGAWR